MHGAFTLVEAMLATATAATVIIVLVTLIPASLEQMTDAARTTAEARIVQTVMADYQMRPWEDILQQQQDETALDLCFDSQGALVKADAPERIFTARVFIHDVEKLPGAPTTNASLRQLLVLVTGRADAGEAFKHPTQHRRHPGIIAQTDRPKSK